MNSAALRGSRVLVTGAAGFLGGHVCAALKAVGATVLRTTRDPALRRAGRSGGQWVQCDLSNRAATAEAVQRLRPDLIIHLAGSSRGGFGGIEIAFDANVMATGNLLMAVAEHCRDIRVVCAGTLECSNPWTEVASFATAYGASKTMAELFARFMQQQHQLDVVSARIAMTYGPGDPNEQRLVPHVITSLLQGRSPQLSSCRRVEDWIYVDDVVDAVLRMAASQARLPATLDVAYGARISARQIVQSIRRSLRSTVPIGYGALPDRPGFQHPADVEQTSRLLDWRPQVDLETGLARTIDWYRKRLQAGQQAVALA